MAKFTAIDFETADHGRDSACAVGLARVENCRVTATAYRLKGRRARTYYSLTSMG